MYLFSKKFIYVVMLFILLLGSLYINILNYNYNQKYIAIDEEVKVKAIVISEPEEKEYKYTYNVKVVKINDNEKYKNTKLIFDLKKSNNLKDIPKYGDEVEIISTIEKPEVSRNYKGFNYKFYLQSKQIYGTIESKDVTIVSENNINIINKFINNVRKNMKKNITNILSKDEAALCIGILVGDREGITDEVENNFKKSNLTHMLAVSGSHITYIITAFSTLLGKTGKRFAKLFTILFLIFFMALTGFTASVSRASIMGILVLLASLIHRKSDTINNLGISSFIILILNPYTVVDIGFILSFAGTMGIVLLSSKINEFIYKLLKRISKSKINLLKEDYTRTEKIAKNIINSFTITLSANLIIIPVIAYSFSTFSFTFWISNILAGPLMEIATIYGFIVYLVSIIIFPLAKFLGIFLNIIMWALLKIAEITSLIPGASIYIKTPYLFECIIYYLVLLCMFNKNKIKEHPLLKKLTKYKVKLVSMLIILLISFSFFNSIHKDLKIYFIDVGQGDCTLIKTPGDKNILIDGGGSEFGNFDVGESILLPYLLDRRITRIDYLMISHFDSDHVKGLFSIMENINVNNIIISKQGKISENLKKFYEIAKRKKIKVSIVKSGDKIKIDKYSYFEILFPENELIKENILNNNSIVAKLNSLEFSMLFTGDIEEIAEKRLYQLYKNTDKLNSTILKVAHHGSKTSTISDFLELVNPRIVLIGVGKDNNFGHPNNGVLSRIKKYTNLIYRTDLNGEIELTYDYGKFKINTII